MPTEKQSFRDPALERYLNEIAKYPKFNDQETVELVKRIRRGNAQALEQLMKSHLQFVVSVAKNYQNYGIPFWDLIQEGNNGLMKAAQRASPKRLKETKFITYAVWWIRQAILKHLGEQSKIVRIPSNRQKVIRKVILAYERLLDGGQRQPTAAAIKKITKLSNSDIIEALLLTNRPVHLDQQDPSTDDSPNIHEIIPDKTAASPDSFIHNSAEFKRAILKALGDKKLFNKREAQIVIRHLGLDGKEKADFRELGNIHGFKFQRAQQIYAAAVKKLRKRLRSYGWDKNDSITRE